MKPIRVRPRRVAINDRPYCTVYEESDLEKIWPGDKEACVINLHTMKTEYVWDKEQHSWIPTPEYRDLTLEW